MTSRPRSPQTLDEPDRRLVAAWAADCAERVLHLFEAEAPADGRPRDAIARARAFARGELGAAEEIRRRFVAGRAANTVRAPAAVAAARAAAQAAGVAHMGAHALGAAAYAVRAVELAAAASQRPAEPDAAAPDPTALDPAAAAAAELAWQVAQLTPDTAAAVRRLPAVGEDTAGPLGSGLLAAGRVGEIIRDLQTRIASHLPHPSHPSHPIHPHPFGRSGFRRSEADQDRIGASVLSSFRSPETRWPSA
ncbi:putative immunity protein [Agromyces sp. LHK192]|uniref:putative immunity protein n=1 Tax=Agromyces sp. LHK192 TaxID=2498704 RepID=UPI0035177B04